MLCFAPLVLIGYALTMEMQQTRHPSTVDGTVIEAQTCETGLGLDAKASNAGLYGLGLQYGLRLLEVGDWILTALPKAGLSYTDRPRHELPMTYQFEVGGQVLLGYDRYRVGLEYWHLSNAGLTPHNLGLDMLIIQTGWRF